MMHIADGTEQVIRSFITYKALLGNAKKGKK
jgi:hypothetical protein